MRGLEYDPDTQRTLQDAINALPGTPDSIAAEFYAKGISGRPCSPSGCAVARYLAPRFPEAQRVSSGIATASVIEDGEAVASVDLPEAVRAFVVQFDNNAYPELLETP